VKKLFTITLTTAVILLSAIVYFSAKYKNNAPIPQVVYGCCPTDLSSAIISGESMAYFEGKKIDIPQLALEYDRYAVLGLSNEEKWIDIDLSEQKLVAWNGNTKFLETAVSTGLPWWKTPTGEFRIWIKLRATKMEGGEGKYYYYLPNVPYVMYFEGSGIPSWRGYGLHGTYWHNDFGTPRSHGCVNLPTEVAAQLYHWVSPELGSNKWAVRSTAQNPGTRIVIHE
jgi:hypothetical protein